MNVKAINEVKESLDLLKKEGRLKAWELPYEQILSRLSAAIFFVTPVSDDAKSLSPVWEKLGQFPNFSYRTNTEQLLSRLDYRVTFSKEEEEKNKSIADSTTTQTSNADGK